MPFQLEEREVQFSDLKGVLSQSKAIDPALYQTIQILLERLDQFKVGHDTTVNNISSSIGNIIQNITVTPNIIATYLTKNLETPSLPSSVQLLAGAGITFDDSVANKRTISVTGGGGGMNLDYFGNYVPGTYNDGDIVIGSDGVAYMCVKDGTTTAPELWPGASGGVPGPHHGTHEVGGSDKILNVAWITEFNAFNQKQRITGSSTVNIASLELVDGTQSFNQQLFRIYNTSQLLHLAATDSNITANSGEVNMDRFGVFTASAGLGSTPLNATQLITGSIPDARLSSNVALRNNKNYFSDDQYIQKPGASIRMIDNNGAVNQKLWVMGCDVQPDFYFQARDDAGNVTSNPAIFRRSGNVDIGNILTSKGLSISGPSSQIVVDGGVGAGAGIALQDFRQPANLRRYRIGVGGGNLYTQTEADDGSPQLSCLSINRSGDLNVTRDLYEKGRTTPMGHWINVPFNVNNFGTDAGGVGSWVVTSGAVNTNKYTLIGKTLFWTVYLTTTNIALITAQLRIYVPGGFTIGSNSATRVGQIYDSSGVAEAIVYCGYTLNYIIIQKNNNVAWAAGSSPVCLFSTCFEIQ